MEWTHPGRVIIALRAPVIQLIFWQISICLHDRFHTVLQVQQVVRDDIWQIRGALDEKIRMHPFQRIVGTEKWEIILRRCSVMFCTMCENETRLVGWTFVPPVPFRLPKLFDLSEWELLLASPADPDFALFPFSSIRKRAHKHTSQNVTADYHRYKPHSFQLTPQQFPTFFGFLPQFKCYCEGLGYCQSHCLSLGNRKQSSYSHLHQQSKENANLHLISTL